jgi:lipopolysaccharide heptosyltransferase II
MTLPALRRLREAHPRARITLVTPEKLNDLWSGSPFLDETLPVAPGESVWSVGRRIRERRYDAGLILPNSPRTALELWLGNVPRRVGRQGSWRRLLLTEVAPQPPEFTAMRKRDVAEIKRLVAANGAPPPPPHAGAHQIFHDLHLAAALGASPSPVAPFIPVSLEEAKQTGAELGIPLREGGAPVLGLVAGAEYGPAKRWPVENFIAAARELRRQTGCVWVLLGGPGDRAVAAEIERALAEGGAGATAGAVVNLAGKTSLRQLCGVMRLCRVVLTNDTGPMHLAAAVGTPVVALFGGTSPELTGPGLPGDPRHRLLRVPTPCSPCFVRECPVDHRCLRGLTPERVAAEVRAVLSRGVKP